MGRGRGYAGDVFSCVFVMVLLVFTMVSQVWALEQPQGKVDWVGGYVQGIGYGTARPTENKGKDRMMAVRAAEVVAQRALAETIHGVRVDGNTVMRDAIKQYMLESRVQGIIRGARKVKEDVTWEGPVPMAMVELRICMVPSAPECRAGASLIEVLPVPDVRSSDNVLIPAAVFEGGKGSSPASSDVSYDSSRPVTGLLLRVEGVRFERKLYPVVVTRGEKGEFRTVYCAKNVKPELVRTQGVYRFTDTLEQARKNPLIGDNPIVIMVREVTSENMMVVPPDVARAIWETTRFGNDFLEHAKVIIAGK